jgi:hypothetical protein
MGWMAEKIGLFLVLWIVMINYIHRQFCLCLLQSYISEFQIRVTENSLFLIVMLCQNSSPVTIQCISKIKYTLLQHIYISVILLS